MNGLETVNKYLIDLENWRNRSDESNSRICAILKDIKTNAVAHNDQETAKSIWHFEQILGIQNKYLSAFGQLKAEKFYDGWCTFERIEIEINSLLRHYEINIDDDKYKLQFIQTHAKQFQSLFPYKLFISPAYLYLEKECTICGQPVLLRHPCGHIKGEIYNGEECLHKITKFEVLEVSVVPNPMQKYSVLFLTNSETDEKTDTHDYSPLKYLMKGLSDPFDGWDMRWTKRRQPHSLYEHVSKDDNCPCDSGKKYKNCCLKSSGVLRPHVEFLFHVPPPEDLPRIFYPQAAPPDEGMPSAQHPLLPWEKGMPPEQTS